VVKIFFVRLRDLRAFVMARLRALQVLRFGAQARRRRHRSIT
jgi:hypothetical protein